MNNMQTIFEKIINGEIPHHKVYEDEFTYAFLDANPNTKGHTLVISKTPYRNILDIKEGDLQKLIVSVQKVAKLLYEKLPGCVGVNIGQNNEPAAGQVVFHIHFHVIPRYEGDGLVHWHGHKLNEVEALKVIESLS